MTSTKTCPCIQPIYFRESLTVRQRSRGNFIKVEPERPTAIEEGRGLDGPEFSA
jgi:hypothetical protein